VPAYPVVFSIFPLGSGKASKVNKSYIQDGFSF